MIKQLRSLWNFWKQQVYRALLLLYISVFAVFGILSIGVLLINAPVIGTIMIVLILLFFTWLFIQTYKGTSNE